VLNLNENSWESVQELFHAQASQTPNEIAIVDGSLEKTYLELDRDSDELSRAIQAIGVNKNELVAIFMESSYEYIHATLGVLKSGAAFLPISTDLPDESILAILHDASPRIILTDQTQAHRVSLTSNITQMMLSDTVDPRMWGEWDNPNIVQTQSSDLAFATYTSGTTGEPKGVLQTQLAMVTSYKSRYDFQPYQAGERVACNIFFMWEFLRPLLQGATCYVIPDSTIYTPRKLVNFLSVNKITEVLLTPSVLQALIASNKGGALKTRLGLLRTIWLNGEVVTHELINQARAALPETMRILNTYSICECHDVANYDTQWISPDQSGPIPVGYPGQGVKVVVIPIGTDESAPKGSGEIYIGGDGLARGYLGQPALTQEKFIDIEHTRFYATGDLGEIADDNLIFIYGRCDSMVKIRGYSVSLGAIEESIRTHCAASEAVVLANGDHLAQHLTAYVIRKDDATWSIDSTSSYSHELRALLSGHLPAHMIPTKFIEIESVPINSVTGKADYKALINLDTNQAEELGLIDKNKDSFENIIQKLWAHALEVDPFAINQDANFFDLGGHSLSAVTLTLDIEEFMGIELEGTEIYESPNLSDFLVHIKGNRDNPHEREQLRFWDDAAAPLSDFVHPRAIGDNSSMTTIRNAASILITGSTGFLGSFLLDSIISNTNAGTKIYCLVRPTDGITAHDRLQTNLLRRGITSSLEIGTRVMILEGDIAKPHFGLQENLYEQLSNEIDTIFHCAANVNLQYGYSQLRDSIVVGTREVFKFATYKNLKSVHYISSNAVFPDVPGRLYRDDTDISSFASAIQGGYGQAKWVADRISQRAREAGVPVNIYRPGNIGPHTHNGSFNSNDLQTMILKACLVTRTAPSDADWQFEMTPVDVVAMTIVEAAAGKLGKNYNVVQEAPLGATLIFSRLFSLGLIQEFLPLKEWLTRVAAVGKAQQDGDLIILGATQTMTTHILTSTASFACENFLSSIRSPRLFHHQMSTSYIDRFLHRMNASLSSNEVALPLSTMDTHLSQERSR
jgi:amino acid adenylation domain-containing protein/thioester reductase-like protein